MVVFGQNLLSSGKSDCVPANWFYSGKVVVFEQKLFYSDKRGCTPERGCIWAKWLHSGKLVVFGQKRLYLGKTGFFRTKWMCSGKSGCIRAK